MALLHLDPRVGFVLCLPFIAVFLVALFESRTTSQTPPRLRSAGGRPSPRRRPTLWKSIRQKLWR